jgi:xanthine dehydrogenase accessory factor
VSLFDEVRAVAEGEEPAVLFTLLEGESAGAKLLARPDGDAVGDAPQELAEQIPDLLRDGHSRVLEHKGEKVFAEVFGPPPRVVVVGAVDTAEALCRAAKALGWRTAVADARARFATRERLPSADELVVGWPDDAYAQLGLGYGDAVVVLTHDEKFDVPAVAGALAADVSYVGALGSRRAQEARRERLREAGVADEDLARVHGPCGLDVGAESPAETAVSILAEILAVRAGRDGGHLRDAKRRIHAERTSDVSKLRTA